LEKEQIHRDKFSEIVKLQEEITNVRNKFKGYQKEKDSEIKSLKEIINQKESEILVLKRDKIKLKNNLDEMEGHKEKELDALSQVIAKKQENTYLKS
jgi:cell shape-determining protein MreC